MKSITVYDCESDLLEQIADANETSIAEIVELLVEYVDEMKMDNNLL